MTWQDYYFKLAELAATKSKDDSTKVGAIIVGPDREVRSLGFNGFPRGVAELPERLERPRKYLFTEHAERNAIYNAARAGINVKGCTMVLQYDLYPCAECSRAIIQVGIVEVIGNARNPFPGRGPQWAESLEAGKDMLREAGVYTYHY